MKEKTPIYRKIIKDIQDKVEDGTYQSGQKLPSERELCKQYQVARGTLKAALSQLKQAGLLEQARGSGTFVREKGKKQSCYQNAKKTGRRALCNAPDGGRNTPAGKRDIIGADG